jgi:hypothetical protein
MLHLILSPAAAGAATARGNTRSRLRSLVLAALALLVTACSATPTRAVSAGADNTPRESTILLVRRGWHVDVGFEVAALEPSLAEVAKAIPGAKYVLFGFGDRRYLLSRDEGSCSGVAALWPGAGLVLLTGLTTPPAMAFHHGDAVSIAVTAAGARTAQDFIWRTLRHTDAPIRPLAKGPYDGSFYFDSDTRYSALHTCNTWAAEVLESAGVPLESAGVVFAGQVWSRARRATTSPSPPLPSGDGNF